MDSTNKRYGGKAWQSRAHKTLKEFFKVYVSPFRAECKRRTIRLQELVRTPRILAKEREQAIDNLNEVINIMLEAERKYQKIARASAGEARSASARTV